MEPRPEEPTPETRSLKALGTTAVVAVTDPCRADNAERVLRQELERIDITCSRFRDDSELSSLNRCGGDARRVSPLLFEAIRVALEVAERTRGAVDPTVGRALVAIGYDRDFDEVAKDVSPLVQSAQRAPGWELVQLDRRDRSVRMAADVQLDLGASAKALSADIAAARIAEQLRCGVLVSVGGDVSVAGDAPGGGWAIGIALDSSTPSAAADQVVAIEGGGLASSSIAVRAWRRGARSLHHIVDPGTGEPADAYWTLVSATGETCVEANAASTASIVWGARALRELEEIGSPARLVRHDGLVVTVNGWPEDRSS